MTTKPKAGRPYMPEYGILDEKEGKGLLPWNWATERLTQSPYYWISTARADGKPHVMPVWGICVKDVLYFSTGRKTRKSKNLQMNPQCAISIQHDNDAVIVEGSASEVRDAALIKRLSKTYKEKYGMALDPKLGSVYAVQPAVVFGLIGTSHSNQDSADFIGTATRWEF